MPKIIDDVKKTILAEAKRQVQEKGYSSLTIRSVANSCKIAVGTIYNYFPSKDVLIASFLLEDWLCAMQNLRESYTNVKTPSECFLCVWNCLTEFMKKFSLIFDDKSAKEVPHQTYSTRHVVLRSQIAEILEEICRKSPHYTEFLPLFVAENLITWASEGKSFDQVNQMLCRLF